jgi:hypothetical protein
MTMIEVQQMSTSERLRAMETLWDSLCQDSEELESPVWHGEILADRKQRIESGEASFLSIEEAKEKLLR